MTAKFLGYITTIRQRASLSFDANTAGDAAIPSTHGRMTWSSPAKRALQHYTREVNTFTPLLLLPMTPSGNDWYNCYQGPQSRIPWTMNHKQCRYSAQIHIAPTRLNSMPGKLSCPRRELRAGRPKLGHSCSPHPRSQALALPRCNAPQHTRPKSL